MIISEILTSLQKRETRTMLAVALFLVLAFFLEILSYLKGSNMRVSNSILSMPHLSHRTHKEKSLFSKVLVGSFHTISLVTQDGKLLKQMNSVKYLGVHIYRICTFM